jgi:hypothetical protein
MSEPNPKPGPIGGEMYTVIGGLARRFRLPALVKRHNAVGVMGLFAFINGLISIGIMAGAALITGAPFIFPSLGPTAFI